jgi:ketosteroid isomerase-like protein
MSQENVEVVRRSWRAFSQRDLDAFINCFDPDIEWHDVANLPDAGVHWGHRTFRRHVEGFIDAWDNIEVESEELAAVGKQVIARIRYSGTAMASGAGVEARATAVYDFRHGRILRVRQFVDHDEALEAAGLRE